MGWHVVIIFLFTTLPPPDRSHVSGNVPRCLCIYIVWSVAPYQFVVLSFQASAPTRLALDNNDHDRSSMGTLVNPHLQSRIIGAR